MSANPDETETPTEPIEDTVDKEAEEPADE